jgi:hypothetical protein
MLGPGGSDYPFFDLPDLPDLLDLPDRLILYEGFR